MIDGAHATADAKNLANYLKTIKLPKYGIWSMMKNKDPYNFIKPENGNEQNNGRAKVIGDSAKAKVDQLMMRQEQKSPSTFGSSFFQQPQRKAVRNSNFMIESPTSTMGNLKTIN